MPRKSTGLMFACAIAVLFGGFAELRAQAPASAQTAQQTMYGVCSYVESGTTYYTQTFTAPLTATSQIQIQFQRYAQGLTPAAIRRVNRCNWALTDAEIQKGVQLILQTTNAKFQKISWQYDASALRTPQAAASTPTPVQRQAMVAANTVSGTATQTAGTGTTVAQPGAQAAKAQTPANAAATTSGSTAAGANGLGSIGSSVQQSAQSAQTNVTNSASTAVNSTVTDMTNAATNAMTNVFKRKPKQANGAAARPANAGTQVASAAGAPPNATAMPSGQQVSAAPSGGMSAGGPSPAGDAQAPVFFVCHLVAGGAEYQSDIFPALPAEQPAASMAFWRQSSKQYSLSNVKFSGNVACEHFSTDEQARTGLQALKADASQRGAARSIDTGWAYMGEQK